MSSFLVYFAVSARNLPSRVRGSTGLSSIPDPYIQIWQKDNRSEFSEFAQTSHYVNNANPDWFEIFQYGWHQGTGQMWKINLKDYDVFNKDDVIGSVNILVDEFVLGKSDELKVQLKDGGNIILRKTQPIRFRLQVENLPKMDKDSPSDPYVECYWSVGIDGEEKRFHKTQTIEDAYNAKWGEVISFPNYHPGTDQWFTLKVFDEDLIKDEKIGKVTFKMDDFVKNRKTATHRLNDGNNNATITIIPVP